MTLAFYIVATIATLATFRVITSTNAIHALLYLVVSLLSAAVIFFLLGAPFAAALEVIVYAGAIMVLFVFVIMMLNLGPQSSEQERRWLSPALWTGPGILSTLLFLILLQTLLGGSNSLVSAELVDPKELGLALFGPYLLGVELAALMLLAGLVGAYHLGRREPESEETE